MSSGTVRATCCMFQVRLPGWTGTVSWLQWLIPNLLLQLLLLQSFNTTDRYKINFSVNPYNNIRSLLPTSTVINRITKPFKMGKKLGRYVWILSVTRERPACRTFIHLHLAFNRVRHRYTGLPISNCTVGHTRKLLQMRVLRLPMHAWKLLGYFINFPYGHKQFPDYCHVW
jgi:hypothetical protein